LFLRISSFAKEFPDSSVLDDRVVDSGSEVVIDKQNKIAQPARLDALAAVSAVIP